jgi:5-formyltetrahydrofolate cyclo-ligase
MKSSIDLNKKEIRKVLIRKRALIVDEDRLRFDRAIYLKVLALDELKQAGTVLIYASYNGEVDTYGLIDECIRTGKRVACPRCRMDKEVPTLDFYFISSRDDLKPGYKGIMEPREDVNKKLSYEDICSSLVIVPMVGYDEAGNRLGYGKGFYDRFLAVFKEAESIGLAYSCQKVSCLPVDEYDVKPDKIITEEKI